jgi:hypothetical protein
MPQSHCWKDRFGQLQEKYIGVLERTNVVLQRELSKSHSSSRLGQSTSRSQLGLGNELQELKERLNRIDLSGISKLAGLQLKGESKTERKADKENVGAPLFRQIRHKI